MGIRNTNVETPRFNSHDNQRTNIHELRRIKSEIAALTATIVGGAAGNSTLAEQILQTTALNSILNNIIASKDIEYLSVRDTVTGIVYQQIREYDEGTGLFVTRYEDVAGAAFVPVNPMIYLDPSAVLNLILTQNTSINSKIITDDDDDAIADSQTLPLNIPLLYAYGDGAWERLITDTQNRLIVALDSIPLATDAATQTTLAALLVELQLKADLTETQPVNQVSTVRTPGLVRRVDATGSPIASGSREVSIYNAGAASGTVLGATLKAGERVTFTAPGNDTLGAISYDGTGTDLIISTIV